MREIRTHPSTGATVVVLLSVDQGRPLLAGTLAADGPLLHSTRPSFAQLCCPAPTTLPIPIPIASLPCASTPRGFTLPLAPAPLLEPTTIRAHCWIQVKENRIRIPHDYDSDCALTSERFRSPPTDAIPVLT